jgi:hypothetical protein
MFSFRLIARSLELPEDTLVDKHEFDAAGETSGMGILSNSSCRF